MPLRKHKPETRTQRKQKTTMKLRATTKNAIGLKQCKRQANRKGSPIETMYEKRRKKKRRGVKKETKKSLPDKARRLLLCQLFENRTVTRSISQKLTSCWNPTQINENKKPTTTNPFYSKDSRTSEKHTDFFVEKYPKLSENSVGSHQDCRMKTNTNQDFCGNVCFQLVQSDGKLVSIVEKPTLEDRSFTMKREMASTDREIATASETRDLPKKMDCHDVNSKITVSFDDTNPSDITKLINNFSEISVNGSYCRAQADANFNLVTDLSEETNKEESFAKMEDSAASLDSELESLESTECNDYNLDSEAYRLESIPCNSPWESQTSSIQSSTTSVQTNIDSSYEDSPDPSVQSSCRNSIQSFTSCSEQSSIIYSEDSSSVYNQLNRSGVQGKNAEFLNIKSKGFTYNISTGDTAINYNAKKLKSFDNGSLYWIKKINEIKFKESSKLEQSSLQKSGQQCPSPSSSNESKTMLVKPVIPASFQSFATPQQGSVSPLNSDSLQKSDCQSPGSSNKGETLIANPSISVSIQSSGTRQQCSVSALNSNSSQQNNWQSPSNQDETLIVHPVTPVPIRSSGTRQQCSVSPLNSNSLPQNDRQSIDSSNQGETLKAPSAIPVSLPETVTKQDASCYYGQNPGKNCSTLENLENTSNEITKLNNNKVIISYSQSYATKSESLETPSIHSNSSVINNLEASTNDFKTTTKLKCKMSVKNERHQKRSVRRSKSLASQICRSRQFISTNEALSLIGLAVKDLKDISHSHQRALRSSKTAHGRYCFNHL